MSALDILANMSRGWNRDPASVALGTARTGVSAALWTSDIDQVQEVWAEPDPACHIISIPQTTFRAEMFFDDKQAWSKPALAGTCTLVVAGQRPRAVHVDRYSVLHLYVPATLLHDTLASEVPACSTSSLALVDPACVRDTVIEHIGREVLAEMRDNQLLSRLRLDMLGQDLAIQLLRRWSNLAGTPALTREPAKGGLAPWQVKRATEYMEDRLADDVSLDDLSKLLDLSTFHLCRAFKQSVGEPPHRWRQRRRMERAREMLAGTDLPVIEVAAVVGYDDPSRFATAFRKTFGLNPSQYRRERHR